MANTTNNLGLVIWAAIVLMVGIVLLQAVSDSTYEATNLGNRQNETITLASSTATLSQDDVTTISSVANASRNFDAFISTVGFNYTKAGVITTNGTFPDGPYNITYEFQPDGYVDHATSRVLINLIILFFAIGIFSVAIYFGLKTMKDLGWI